MNRQHRFATALANANSTSTNTTTRADTSTTNSNTTASSTTNAEYNIVQTDNGGEFGRETFQRQWQPPSRLQST